MRRHKAHADPDIAPYLKPLRTSDCRVGVAVQELLAQRGIYWKLYQLQYKDQELGVPQPQVEPGLRA